MSYPDGLSEGTRGAPWEADIEPDRVFLECGECDTQFSLDLGEGITCPDCKHGILGLVEEWDGSNE